MYNTQIIVFVSFVSLVYVCFRLFCLFGAGLGGPLPGVSQDGPGLLFNKIGYICLRVCIHVHHTFHRGLFFAFL